jgi:hypothetical protein
MLTPLDVQIRLDKIHCFDEGDGIGTAEPYLWAVFFKIDGDSTFINEQYVLQGTVKEVFTNLGDHGNLSTQDVDAGDDVPIPAQFGYGTRLTPIPLRVPILETTHFPGIMGCIVILLEEDETSDSAVASGHAALQMAVTEQLNRLIPTLRIGHTEPTDEEIKQIEDKVTAAIEDAIARDTRVLGWIYAGGNMDDNIGSEVFKYSQNALLDAGPGGIAFSTRWRHEGDWEITGRAWCGNWSEWEDVGGMLAAAPAIVSRQENRLDCFIRGSTDHMLHKWWNGSVWSDWEDLGGPPAPPVATARRRVPIEHLVGSTAVTNQQLTSAPAAASWGPNRIDCFGRGIDRHLWHKWWDGAAWSDWEDLGGILTSAPAVASWGPNRLDCFVRGTDDHMYHKWWDGSAWSDWEDLGGILTSAPAVASWGPNRLDCFVRGTNTHMYHKWWDGSAWIDWEDLGGGLSAAPAAASRHENSIDCFVRGTDNHMWYKRWDGSDWRDWEDLGGILTDAPAAESWAANRLDCFVRGTDNHMWHKWWSVTPRVHDRGHGPVLPIG